MSNNKKIFKELYYKKINKTNNYNQILNKINQINSKKNIYKKVFIPITSFSLVIFLIIININESSNKQLEQIKDYNNQIYIDEYNNSNTNKNESYTTSSKPNINIENIKFEELLKEPNYSFISNLNIPANLNNKTYQKITENNILKNYKITYQNNDRIITISISDKYEFIRNNNKGNETNIKINNHDLTIYQNEYIYTITFTYNNLSIDIETNNITYQELTNLLASIIK